MSEPCSLDSEVSCQPPSTGWSQASTSSASSAVAGSGVVVELDEAHLELVVHLRCGVGDGLRHRDRLGRRAEGGFVGPLLLPRGEPDEAHDHGDHQHGADEEGLVGDARDDLAPGHEQPGALAVVGGAHAVASR